jgi:F0F1-type ATP synthase assembly protein I
MGAEEEKKDMSKAYEHAIRVAALFVLSVFVMVTSAHLYDHSLPIVAGLGLFIPVLLLAFASTVCEIRRFGRFRGNDQPNQ